MWVMFQKSDRRNFDKMMGDMGKQVEQIVGAIENDLKEILWNGEKTVIKSLVGSYQVRTRIQNSTITIKIEPR